MWLMCEHPRPAMRAVVCERSPGSVKMVLTLAMLAAFAAPSNADWKPPVDPPAKTVVWPAKLQLGMPQPPQFDELLFPSTESPYCLGGLGAYDSSQAVLVDL